MSFEEIVDYTRLTTDAGHMLVTVAHLEHRVLR